MGGGRGDDKFLMIVIFQMTAWKLTSPKTQEERIYYDGGEDNRQFCFIQKSDEVI